MKLIPIYLSPPVSTNDDAEWARYTLRWLGVPSTVRLRPPPRGSRHSFRCWPGWTRLGTVRAPAESKVVDGEARQLLRVPMAHGFAWLSAADVAEQASVGGCGLAWEAERPAAWYGVMAAEMRQRTQGLQERKGGSG